MSVRLRQRRLITVELFVIETSFGVSWEPHFSETVPNLISGAARFSSLLQKYFRTFSKFADRITSYTENGAPHIPHIYGDLLDKKNRSISRFLIEKQLAAAKEWDFCRFSKLFSQVHGVLPFSPELGIGNDRPAIAAAVAEELQKIEKLEKIIGWSCINYTKVTRLDQHVQFTKTA